MEYITIRTLMTEMNVTKPTVYAWIKRGLKVTKIGKLTRIDREDFKQFLEEARKDQRSWSVKRGGDKNA
jgi:excisionase family DNA binding protein